MRPTAAKQVNVHEGLTTCTYTVLHRPCCRVPPQVADRSGTHGERLVMSVDAKVDDQADAKVRREHRPSEQGVGMAVAQWAWVVPWPCTWVAYWLPRTLAIMCQVLLTFGASSSSTAGQRRGCDRVSGGAAAVLFGPGARERSN